MPDWDNQKALTIFERMLARSGNKINAVAAANDGLGNAVITALKARKLEKIPVTGQDATAQGVQNILSGDQCMTVYKAIKAEADAAAALAISLAQGQAAAASTAGHEQRQEAGAVRAARRRSRSRRRTTRSSSRTGS